MTISLLTNTSASIAARGISSANNKVKGSTAKLATGHRVNSAADDAAALGVATNLRATATSARQAMRNANDGVSILQTADGATDEVVNILTRIRELAVQSSSSVLASTERSYAETEVAELVEEIARIAENTEFNGIQLTDGGVTSLSVQVGTENKSSSRIDIDLIDLTTTALSVGALSVADVGSARTAIDIVDAALVQVSSERSTLGAEINRMESAFDTVQAFAEATTAAESTIRDADFAAETADLTTAQILQQAAIAVLSQAKGINKNAVSLLED
jgi:flagellin